MVRGALLLTLIFLPVTVGERRALRLAPGSYAPQHFRRHHHQQRRSHHRTAASPLPPLPSALGSPLPIIGGAALVFATLPAAMQFVRSPRLSRPRISRPSQPPAEPPAAVLPPDASLEDVELASAASAALGRARQTLQTGDQEELRLSPRVAEGAVALAIVEFASSTRPCLAQLDELQALQELLLPPHAGSVVATAAMSSSAGTSGLGKWRRWWRRWRRSGGSAPGVQRPAGMAAAMRMAATRCARECLGGPKTAAAVAAKEVKRKRFLGRLSLVASARLPFDLAVAERSAATMQLGGLGGLGASAAELASAAALDVGRAEVASELKARLRRPDEIATSGAEMVLSGSEIISAADVASVRTVVRSLPDALCLQPTDLLPTVRGELLPVSPY